MPAETHVEQGPMDRQRGRSSSIRDRLADILEIEPSTITEGDSFADDLEADSLALIELVEALEEELGERTVGFRIDDEDLEDLKTVRDAVDYVVARLWADRSCTPTTSTRLAERLGYPFPDPDLLALAVTHRSWCAEHAGPRVERAARVPRRRRARPGRHRPHLPTRSPTCPRASWPRSGRRS